MEWLGILLSLASAILVALSVVFQKKGVSELPPIKLSEANSMKNLMKSKTWILGIVLGQLSWVMYAIALGVIGVAIAHPLITSTQLALTPIFASFLINEKLEKVELVGIVILIMAPIFLFIGDVTPVAVNPTSASFFGDFWSFVAIWSIVVIILIVLFIATKQNPIIHGSICALLGGCAFGLTSILTQSGVELIKYGQIDFWFITLVFFFFMLIGTIIGTLLQQIAFQKGKAGISNGLDDGMSITISVLGGVLIFSQVIQNMLLFAIGFVLIAIGFVLLIRFQENINAQEIERDPNHIYKDSSI